MDKKNYVDVIIDDKVYTLAGGEAEGYMQGVGAYLNSKFAEMKQYPGYKRQPGDVKQLLMLLNVADDYFKMKQRAEEAEEKLERREAEIYGLKHDLVSLRLEMEKEQED